jgi:hypothetical protein
MDLVIERLGLRVFLATWAISGRVQDVEPDVGV